MKTKALYKPKQKIFFQMDNNAAHSGEGTFRRWFSTDCIVVKLTKAVKDHEVGEELIISENEIV